MTKISPVNRESFLKTVERLALLSWKPILLEYEGRRLEFPGSNEIRLSGSLARRFLCPQNCGACCSIDGTLDWLSFGETMEDCSKKITVSLNGVTQTIDEIEDKFVDGKCLYLDELARCKLWPDHPIECATAAVIRVTKRSTGVTILTKQGFGRPHLWEHRPQCQYVEESTPILSDVILILERHLIWARAFKLETAIPMIIDGLKRAPSLPITFYAIKDTR